MEKLRTRVDIWKDFSLRRTGVGMTFLVRQTMVRQSFRKREMAGWRTDEVGPDSVNCLTRALEGRQSCVLGT